MPFPEWMKGCPGRTGGISGYSAHMPSLTGLHRFDRISRKKTDEGKTQCVVCGSRPAHGSEMEAWQYLMAAEAETERIRTQEKIMRSVARGYSL